MQSSGAFAACPALPCLDPPQALSNVRALRSAASLATSTSLAASLLVRSRDGSMQQFQTLLARAARHALMLGSVRHGVHTAALFS